MAGFSFSTRIGSDVNYEIFPVANPSGYDHALIQDPSWIRNRRSISSGCEGARLDRNFNFQFSALECEDENYGGPSAGSEPEVKFITKHLTENNFEAVVVVGTGLSSENVNTEFQQNLYIFQRTFEISTFHDLNRNLQE